MATDTQHTIQHILEEHHTKRPVKTKAEHVGLNGRIALLVTDGVGTMWCAYAFAILALIALPSVHTILELVQWISQTFIQLVMLSVIMVGQNIQALASDHRSEQTFEDAESLLKANVITQQHLSHQDDTIQQLLEKIVAQNEELIRLRGTVEVVSGRVESVALVLAPRSEGDQGIQ